MATVPSPDFDKAVNDFQDGMAAWRGEVDAFRDLVDLMYPPAGTRSREDENPPNDQA